MIDESLRQEEEKLRAEIGKLSAEQKKQYYALEVEKVKDPDTYAALNWFFLAGLHHFYLGKWQRGALNLVLMSLGVILWFTLSSVIFGGSLIAIVFIIELPQLFNSQRIIHRYNNDLMKSLLNHVSS